MKQSVMRRSYEKSTRGLHYEQIDTEEEIVEISPSVLGQEPNRTSQEHAQEDVPVNTHAVGGQDPDSIKQDHAPMEDLVNTPAVGGQEPYSFKQEGAHALRRPSSLHGKVDNAAALEHCKKHAKGKSVKTNNKEGGHALKSLLPEVK